MSRIENYRAVQAELEVDEVLTGAQLARAGLTGNGVPSRELSVRPLVTSKTELEEPVRFFARTSAFLLKRPADLAHLAGIAESRRILGVSGDRWMLDRGGYRQRPDAVFPDAQGDLIAVEFDAGYPRPVVRHKVRSFSTSFAGLVWATPSVVRARHLRSAYPEMRVMCVDYWSMPQTSS